jgi:SAM-dependent methyltransferase
MLKMYQKYSHHSGSSPDFWEENWEAAHFESSVRFCLVDPLRELFEKYLKPASLVLEGGCGMGHYMAYYAARGHRMVGLDFAREALNILHIRQPHLSLCGGDVSRLPFADDTFDMYYSGGVVEHFEGGAESSLLEARRVLKDDGTLLISVPYQSPLRTLLAPFKKNEWRKVSESRIEGGAEPKGTQFFQYAYRRREFEKMLASAGLRVIEAKGYAVMWGLYDIPFLNPGRKGEFQAAAAEKQERKEITAIDLSDLIEEKPVSLLKRLAVVEDAAVPILGLGVKLARWTSANMMMYVCKKVLD